MKTRDYYILAGIILILLIAGYLLTKPQYYITEKPADQLEKNDEVVIQDQPYIFQNKSEVPDEPEQIQLNFLDPDAEEVTLTVNKTDPIPVKIPVALFDLSPIPPPPPPTSLPAPAPPPPPPVQVPVPIPPAPPNATAPPVPPPPNVSVPTPPNVTTPPVPLPPNVTPPTPPTPNITNITPIPPNVTPPIPPTPVPPTPPPPTYPPTCSDGIWNGDESDLDCGGLCPPCLSTGMYNYCWDNSDCVSGNCDTSGAQPLPPGYTIQSIRLLAGQAWIIPYQGQCR